MTQYANDLKQQVERILGWEPSSHWQLRDFRQLSERLFVQTGQLVPATELRAFWQSADGASPLLLNTLARFADYADWPEFLTRNFYGRVEVDGETALTHAPGWEIPLRWVIVICWLAVVASVLVSVLLVWKR